MLPARTVNLNPPEHFAKVNVEGSNPFARSILTLGFVTFGPDLCQICAKLSGTNFCLKPRSVFAQS